MTFSRGRERQGQLRPGFGSGLLERARTSDLYIGESGTFRGLRARESRQRMLAGATVGSVAEYLFAFTDGTDWSDDTQWTDTPA